MRAAWAVAAIVMGTSCDGTVTPVTPSQQVTGTDSTSADSAHTSPPVHDSTRTKSDSVVTPPDTTIKKTKPDSTIPAPDTALSPTGRDPRLVWTGAQQLVWNRMRAENDPLYRLMQTNCDDARMGHPRYGDRGLWCTLMYQITGDTAYAHAAWKLAEKSIEQPPPNGNDVREDFIENAILFDWLLPSLTPDQREAAVAGLNNWAAFALDASTTVSGGGVRLGDSDANIGYYFGLAATDLATAGVSPAHVNWLGATQSAAGAATVPVGGLDATAVDRSTLRNTIAEYVADHGTGGEWFESTDYNLGTQVLLLMGAAAVRTATGTDHFPEITSYLNDADAAQVEFTTADLRQTPQWGDVQNPRDFLGQGFRLPTLLGVLSGLGAQWHAPAALDAQGLLEAILTKYGITGYGAANPWARFFLFYNPYAPANAPSTANQARYFPGTGHLIVRTATTLFDGRMVNPTHADHDLGYLRDFQLYRNGEWALTHPIGYGGGAQYAQGNNSLLLAGLSVMPLHGPEGVQSGDRWWSITGSTSGDYYSQPYYEPPPSFLREWRSSVVYLQRGGLDIIVVQDSVDADDPRLLPNLTRYRATDLASMTKAPALLQLVLHAPTPPATADGVTRWQTPGGQPVVAYTFAPGPITTTILPEATVLTPSSFSPKELTGYQIRFAPAYTGGSIVVHQVIVVGADSPLTVTSSGSTVQIGSTSVTFGPTIQVTN